MAKGIQITGLQNLINKIGRIEFAMREEVNAEIAAGAYEMNAVAANNIQKNNSIGFSGGLFRDQQVVKENESTYLVTNLAPYAAFVEFGTGARANPPADWSEYALTFKGKHIAGPGGDFFERIYLWVKAKGLAARYKTPSSRRRLGTKSLQEQEDRSLAYVIMRSIMRNGAYAHPFLYPAFKATSPKIIQNVKKALERAINS